jgi:hypothetical protein
VKTAIYIENGVTQLVLTPEDEWEQNVLKQFGEGDAATVKIMRGSFYECRGGWSRVKFYESRDRGPFGYGGEPPVDSSLILRVSATPEIPE